MPILDNQRKEKFAQCLVNGMSQRQSYLSSYTNSKKWKDATVDNKASKLFKEHEVSARFKELQQEAADEAVLSVVKRKIILSEIASDDEERPNDRIKAIDSLNKMEGVGSENVNLNGKIGITNPFKDLTTEELRKLARSEKYDS